MSFLKEHNCFVHSLVVSPMSSTICSPAPQMVEISSLSLCFPSSSLALPFFFPFFRRFWGHSHRWRCICRQHFRRPHPKIPSILHLNNPPSPIPFISTSPLFYKSLFSCSILIYSHFQDIDEIKMIVILGEVDTCFCLFCSVHSLCIWISLYKCCCGVTVTLGWRSRRIWRC